MAKKTIYVCITDRCQLQCKHCYRDSATFDSSRKLNDMDFLKLSYVRSYIRSAAQEDYNPMGEEYDDVSVVLHGGEPMMYYNLDYLKKFVLQMNYDHIPITMTTNLLYELTPIRKDIINLCSLDHFSGVKFISTSWDAGDVRFKTPEQKELWEKNVRHLLMNGINIQPICTVTTELIKEDPEQLMEYFHELGVKYLNFERLTVTGRAVDNVYLKPTNRQAESWLFKVYKLNKEKGYFEIPLFTGIDQSLFGNHIGCRARQCVKNVRTINPDFSIGSCPNCAHIPVDVMYSEETRMIGSSIETIDKYDNLLKEEANVDMGCLLCTHYKECNGDCFQLKWDETGCPGFPTIYEYAKLKLQEDLRQKVEEYLEKKTDTEILKIKETLGIEE